MKRAWPKRRPHVGSEHGRDRNSTTVACPDCNEENRLTALNGPVQPRRSGGRLKKPTYHVNAVYNASQSCETCRGHGRVTLEYGKPRLFVPRAAIPAV